MMIAKLRLQAGGEFCTAASLVGATDAELSAAQVGILAADRLATIRAAVEQAAARFSLTPTVGTC